jgi:putative spermidine/putrescine transport system substrate-binding protein
MRRRWVLCTVLVIAMAMIGALPVLGATKINLYSSGSDNVRIQWEALIEAFSKTNKDVQVVQQYMASGAGTRTDVTKLIAAFNSGQKDIDIDIMADIGEGELSQIKTQASFDALLKLDAKQLPNWAGVLSKSILSPDRALVYRGTNVFLAYNSTYIKTPPKTADELLAWIKANPGKFAYNDPGTGGAGSAFVTTTIYNLLPAEALQSAEERWMERWFAGFAVLKDIHPYLYKASGKVQYTVKNQGSLDLLAAGSIWMCPAWADMTLDQKSKGLLPASIKLAQIEPALTGTPTSLIIPVMSKNAAAAYKFMNYVVSVEAQDLLVNVMKAIPVIDPKRLPPATLELLSGLQMKEYRIAALGGLGTKLNQRWTQEIATLP